MSGAGESPRVPLDVSRIDEARAWWGGLDTHSRLMRLNDAKAAGSAEPGESAADLSNRTLLGIYAARFQPINASTVNPAALNWWAMLGPHEREDRLRDLRADGFALTCTARNVSPRTLAIMYERRAAEQKEAMKITAANAHAARLGGDGEPYPEDLAIPVPIRGGLSGPRQSTPEERAKAAWPGLAEQTKCWPPKSKADEERAVMSDARATLDLAALAGDEVDWAPLAYRLARVPKAREAIFAAMDVEGRPWRWADTVVITLFALVFMAAGAAMLAVAAKLAA